MEGLHQGVLLASGRSCLVDDTLFMKRQQPSAVHQVSKLAANTEQGSNDIFLCIRDSMASCTEGLTSKGPAVSLAAAVKPTN